MREKCRSTWRGSLSMCAPEFGHGEKIQGLAGVSRSRHSRIEPIDRTTPNSAHERRARDEPPLLRANCDEDHTRASVVADARESGLDRGPGTRGNSVKL